MNSPCQSFTEVLDPEARTSSNGTRAKQGHGHALRRGTNNKLHWSLLSPLTSLGGRKDNNGASQGLKIIITTHRKKEGRNKKDRKEEGKDRWGGRRKKKENRE